MTGLSAFPPGVRLEVIGEGVPLTDVVFIVVIFVVTLLLLLYHTTRLGIDKRHLDEENFRLLRRVCELETVLLEQYEIVVRQKPTE